MLIQLDDVMQRMLFHTNQSLREEVQAILEFEKTRQPSHYLTFVNVVHEVIELLAQFHSILQELKHIHFSIPK